MNKKAQIFGEPFIFIFAIVVAAMVLAFGINVYYDLSERADFAQAADVVQRINENIITFYNLEEGSQNTFTFQFPSTIDCICFVGENIIGLALIGHCQDDAFKATIESTGGPNMVFWRYNPKKGEGIKSASLPDKFKIKSKFVTPVDATDPSGNRPPLCVDLVAEKYKLKITLASQGDKVLIEKAT